MEEISYSDGARVESRILDILKEEKDLSSARAVGAEHYSEWATEYHLCPERANLLRPFDFTGLDVLELGAGMGAVSRFLAENARSLHVVEGTQARFDALSERLRDLHNWSGQVGNLQDALVASKFDVVCVIGVLEYAELFLTGDPSDPMGPFAAFLQKARSFLKPEGVLILAIENQLGLKYLAGASEDHLGSMFSGVCGYPNAPSAKTFSRRVLVNLLRREGWGEIDEYFPFPDYKIPSAVLSRKAVENYPLVSAELAASRPYRDYLHPEGQRLYPEWLATRSFADAGLLADVANSFLVLASDVENSPVRARLLRRQRERNELAWYYSRRRAVPTTTVLLSDGRVRKEAREKERSFELAGGNRVRWSLVPESPWARGESFVTQWHRLGYFDGAERCREWLGEFIEWSFGHWAQGSALRGSALDATATNATFEKGSFFLFDLEWESEGPISKSWFILRNLFVMHAHRQVLLGSASQSFRGWYDHYCSRWGIVPDWEMDLNREAAFQMAASGQGSAAEHRASLVGCLEAPFSGKSFPKVSVGGGLRRYQIADRFHAAFYRFPAASLLKRAAGHVVRTLRAVRATGARRKRAVAVSRLDVPVPDSGPGPRWGLLRYSFPEAARLSAVSGGTTFALAAAYRRGFRVLKLSEPIERVTVEGVGAEKGRATFRYVNRGEASLWLFYSRLLMVRQTEGWRRWISRGLDALRRGGRRGILGWLRFEVLQGALDRMDDYAAWVTRYDTLTEGDLSLLKGRVESFRRRPLISLLVPVYNTEVRWLERLVDSVLRQVYPDWELCLVDDASSDTRIQPLLERLGGLDPRIRISHRTENGGIALASNAALTMATGELAGLLDHDDELAPHALFWVAAEWNRSGEWDYCYSDEDKIDADGRRFWPHFKPGWNETLFHSVNYLAHFSVFRISTLRALGGLRTGFEGSQDYDLLLRLVDLVGPSRLRHIPRVLYHWRSIPESVAGATGAKPYAVESARRALREHFGRIGISADVLPGFDSFHRVRYPLPDILPKVSAIVCTRDRVELLRTAVTGLLEKTDYPNLEVIIVDNQSERTETLSYLETISKDPRVRLLRFDAPFNFSAMNNAAARLASGEFLALVNNDLQVIGSDWLGEMVRWALRPEVGAVGAKLLYPNGLVQHAGVVTGIAGVAGHVHRNLSRNDAGYVGRAQLNQEFTAVTAACLVVSRSRFESVGGFDEVEFPVAFNDVDFCLKLVRAGYRNVWTPYAELIHHESASRGSDGVGTNFARFQREYSAMQARWGEKLERDPAYNPNLTLEGEGFGLAFPPRLAGETDLAAAGKGRPLASGIEGLDFAPEF